jgi:Flp pilus assembly protein TadD
MSHRTILLVILLLPFSGRAGQNARNEVSRKVVQQAASEFQAGQASEAEEILRCALKETPYDPAALGMLGAVLDAQQRCGEAQSAYHQALALAPCSPVLLNNLGNHYLVQGKTELARAAFLEAVTAKPRHPNTNLQSAQLSVDAKHATAAFKFLGRLPPEDQASPAVAILRARALKLSGRDKAAGDLLAEVERKAGHDPRVAFSIGMAFAGWQRYGEAEDAFTRALDADPINFDILYNLGLAAQHAGHLARADLYIQGARNERQ